MPFPASAFISLLAITGFSVGACTRERPAPTVLTVARGTEPFWSLEVRSDRVLFSRLGADSVVYPYAPPAFDVAGRVVYRTKRFSVDPLLELVVTRGACSDGMSDQQYPGSAVLTRGDTTWRGCVTMVPDSATAQ